MSLLKRGGQRYSLARCHPAGTSLAGYGALDIPVTAYYTRLSDTIQAGKVSAVAQYTLQYK
ncbi:fimbrial protein [Salmonella enterica]|nr:fimbrial protein [Salmonella enterica]